MVRDRVTTPDFLSLIQSPGFAEITAYTFIAIATIGLQVCDQDSWWSLRATRIRQCGDVTLSRCESVAIAAAILLIVGGAAAETGNILGLTGRPG